LSSLIRRATLPGVDFRTEVKNQFNKRRIITTGVDMRPVEFTVLDTLNNDWLTVLMKMYAYNFMNPRNKNRFNDRDIQVNKAMVDEMAGSMFKGDTFASNEAGLNLQFEKNFFERIDFILYHGGKGVQYSVTNPTVTSFTPKELDYASSEFMEFTIVADYENFTTFDIANFELGEVDLDRFEDLPDGFEFFGDDTIIKPLGTEVETDFEFLGNKVSERASGGGSRNRTSQPSNFTVRDAQDGLDIFGDGAVGNFFDDLVNDAVNTIAVKPTYDDYETSFKNKAVGLLGDALVGAAVRGFTNSSPTSENTNTDSNNTTKNTGSGKGILDD
tara:strand:+ start:345 stop:1331 length:987 start_codon:yes stop_codon:yes gene_type:complete